MRRNISSLESLPEDFAAYAKVNPAYRDDLDPRLVEEIKALSVKKTRDELVEGKIVEGKEAPREITEIALNLLRFQTALKVKMVQIEGNKTWAEKGPASEENFKKSPRTFLKTAQEVLSNPMDRMAFDRSDNISESINDIIIDPRLITNTLLEDLGLNKYIPAKGLRKELQIELRAEAIPEIRKMLSHLEAIRRPGQKETADEKLNYFRLMRIGEGENKGYVVGTQNIGDHKILFKSDIYSARRRIEHIRKDYDVEVSVLYRIKENLEKFRDKLEYWKKPEKRAELEQFRDGMLKHVDLLNFVRDDHKQEMKSKIMKCLTFDDSLGRPNPNVKGNQLTSAIKYMGMRAMNISGISREIGVDGNIVRALIAEQIAPLQSFYDTVTELHDRFAILHKESLQPAEKEKILGNLENIKVQSQNMIFEPDMSFGAKFIEQIDKTIAAVSEDDLKTGAKEFVKMYLIVKLKKTQMQLDRVYSQLSLNPDGVEIGPMINRLEGIRKELAMKNVADEISTKEYDSAYGEVYHLLNSLKTRLVELKEGRESEKVIKRSQKIAEKMKRDQVPLFEMEEKEVATERKLAVIEVMKERLDGFSFENLVRGLN